MKKQEETKTTSTAVAISDRSADAGIGFENFNPNKDLKIPFLQIIQGLSPELTRGNAKYIQGAEKGDIFNSVTRKLYKTNEPDGTPLKFVPITHVRVHNEWVKRSLKGGYIKTYPDGMQPGTIDGFDGQKKVKELENNKEHCLVETVMHDVNILDEDGTYEAIISMAGSNLGPSRDFTSRTHARKEKRGDGSQYTPPVFDNLCLLSTVLKPFAQGECYVFKIDFVGRTPDTVYADAKIMHTSAKDRLALMAPVAAQLEDKTDKDESPY